MQSQTTTYRGTSTGQVKGDERSTQKKVALVLFWAGLLVAAAFAGVAGWELTRNLRTLTSEELGATIWNFGGPAHLCMPGPSQRLRGLPASGSSASSSL
jgi:hypothetical protein